MKESKNYLNLTNGIGLINSIKFDGYVRIQSSLIEAKNCWNKIFYDLDYNFLLNLAVGNSVTVYDASILRNKKGAKAIRIGIPVIKYMLEYVWGLKRNPIIINDQDHTENYEEMIHTIEKPVKHKIKYFDKFILTDTINLTGMSFPTNYDGQYDKYKMILKYYYQGIGTQN